MTTGTVEDMEPTHEEVQLPNLVLLSDNQNSQPFDAISNQDTQLTSDTVDLTDVEAMEIDYGQDFRNEVEIKKAAAGFATESKEDGPIPDALTDEIGRQISQSHHLSMEHRSPLSATPVQTLRPLPAVLQPFHLPGCEFPISSHNFCQVLYQLKGAQMFVINSTSPGQLKAINVLPPGQMMDNKDECIHFNSLAGSIENTAVYPVTGFLGKVLPISTPQSSCLNLQQLQQAPGGPVIETSNLSTEPCVHIPFTISLTRLPIMTTDSRSKKPCNCTKSQCLKLYCDCFANGEFCSNCNCTNCFNNIEHEAERFKAIKACLDRNPEAFRPKIGKGMLGEIKLRHNKGCNCKRSGCLKNYCECYEAKIMCSSICKCIGCRNYEESPERRTLMSIPDFSDISICQPRTNLFPEILNYGKQVKMNRERHPFTFITWDVVDATCGCLLAQAEEAEKAHHSLPVAEHMILEEFGRCLAQILHLEWRAEEMQCL
ncbi:spexin prohormone 2 isoform X1 [Hypanus sabinus]|uniref:spexin prohormone 2 isoform X1 n=1 Tax=Hypanus sabinus TaxID=79690 RepID=UPI0028C453C9|nr:spexin prohormone 2 isoform X1 [Hypanus sabinus]